MAMTRCALLPAYAVIAATGRDAHSFLQGQLSNDLLGVERHPGLLAAACNREGRVLATLRLAADRGDVLLVLRRELVPALVGRLEEYVLRADVAFEDCAATHAVAGLLDAEPDRRWTPAAAATTGLSMLVASPRRILLVGPREALDFALRAIPASDEADWERVCIEEGEPSIRAGTAGLWLPQMLNLDLLAGISFTKGCYVGQEIVARTQHLGRVKRRMLRYAGPDGAVLQPGQALYRGRTRAAHVVAATGPVAPECLAVVDLAYCGDLLGQQPGGSEFVPASLPYLIPAPAPAVAGSEAS